MTTEARKAADEASSHPFVTGLARVGHAVNGLLHLLIAGIALQVAWGSGGGQQADQSGALATLAAQPFGSVILWVVVVGAVALGLWYLLQVIAPSAGEDELSDRAKSAAKGVVYLAIGVSASRFAMGGGSSGSSEQQTTGFTQELMSAPAGQWLVAAVGLVVVGIGAFYARKGITKGFLDDLEQHPGSWAVHAGRIGYVAKGVVLALVGVFFGVAAWQQESEEATGLDGALKSLREQPFGPYLLTVAALGLVAFGLYCFARARYARLD